MGDDYGALPPKGLKVVLEHTSVNPTGPIHVGRARNPILGDSLVRIMRKAGYEVSSEFYVNDVGKQVVMLAWGVLNIPEEGTGGTEKEQAEGGDSEKPDHEFVRFYQRANELYEKDPQVKDEVDLMLQRYERGDAHLINEVSAIVRTMLDGMLASLGAINVTLDRFVWESEFLRNDRVRGVVEDLRKSEWCREDDGALYLDISSFVPGQEKYYITRADGTSLYTVRDMTYHLDKFGRCDLAINVLGEDQKLGMEALKVGLKLLGSDKAPENIFYSFVSLPEGRMSTRKGVVVYLDNLVEEALERAMGEIRKRRSDLGQKEMEAIARVVGVGAIRYNIVRVQAEKSIVFRWDEALSFEGNSAPFVQYAHARCHGILKNVEGPAGGAPDHSRLGHPNEKALVKVLSRFPWIVGECAEMRKAHTMASYAYGTASAFNLFYRDCPVLQTEEKLRRPRLALVESTKIVLRNALDLLGIEAPDSM